jgi:glycosyltransferase involved in cell wall biosynthesis
MAHGLPVIATPCCGQVVEDGVDGFVVPPRDAGALAGVMRRYLSEADLLQKQREAALAKSRQFTLEKLGEKLRKLVEQKREEGREERGDGRGEREERRGKKGLKKCNH